MFEVARMYNFNNSLLLDDLFCINWLVHLCSLLLYLKRSQGVKWSQGSDHSPHNSLLAGQK